MKQGIHTSVIQSPSPSLVTPSQRANYVTPKLERLGSVSDLVKGNGSAPNEGAPNAMSMGM